MTISTPVVNIPVPPNVLQAWDRVLLASTRHLTLLITGLQNVYPVLARDGSMTLEAIRRSVSLNFQLGLTPRNKPSRTHAQAASRSYVLVVEEEETLDPLAMEEDLSVDYGFVPPPKVEEPEDAGVFERFALSQPLEALLNHNFLNMLRIRLKFKVGWAGAEMMQAIIDKTQSQVDEVYHTHKKVRQ
jgi:ubiquitin-conjugating enzyme E2 Q